MLNEFRKRIDELSENFNKEIGMHLKKNRNHKEPARNLKNRISEVKNSLGGINKRLEEAENRISNLEDKEVKNTQSEQQKEKRILK